MSDATIADLSSRLDRGAPEPLHDQISMYVRERIVSGRWPAHMRLPSEPEMAQNLGVARGTLRRALRSLIDDGLLVQHQGRGTFVRSSMLEQSFAQELISTAGALDRDGLRYETKVVSQTVTSASEHVAGHLHLPDAGAEVVAIRRVRYVAGMATYVLDNYIVARRCSGLEHVDLSSRPLFSVMEDEYGVVVDGVQRNFQSQVASHAIAALLNVAAGSPILYLEQISYEADSNPVEYSDVWIRGDQVRLSAWLRR